MSHVAGRSSARVANLQKIDRLCDTFDAAWLAGQHPHLEAYLEQFDGGERRLLLRELLEIEIYHRCRRGETLSAREFKQRFAESMEPDLEAAISNAIARRINYAPRMTLPPPRADAGPGDEPPGVTAAPPPTPGADGADGGHRSTIHLPQALPPKSNRYSIVKLLVRGGMGEVWVADDLEIGRRVAYKRIRRGTDELQERFFSEAQITGQLEHPGIVPVHELGRDGDGNPFYVMRLIQGRTLKEVIADSHANMAKIPANRDLAWLKLLEAFVAICRTVSYAHHRGVIHRDLKPDNIMVGMYGETLVVDWGLAKVLDLPEVSASRCISLMRSGGPGSTATQDGHILGSPHYMSPEMAAGNIAEADTKTDIYLLGATLYQILTNRPPRQGGSNEEIVNQARKSPPVPPRKVNPAVPPALDAICVRALAHDKAERYDSAQELAEEIERYLAGDAVAAYREPWFDKAVRWARRRRRELSRVASITLLMLLAGGGFLAWYQVDTQRGLAIEELRRRDLHTQAEQDEKEILRLAGALRFALADTLPVDRVYGLADPVAIERNWREIQSIAERWDANWKRFPFAERRQRLLAEYVELSLLRAQHLIAGRLSTTDATQLLQELDQLADSNPPSYSFHHLRALCAFRAGQSQLAELALNQSRSDPLGAVDYYLRGERLRLEGQSQRDEEDNQQSTWKPSRKSLRDAIADYQRCLDLDSAHFWSRLQKGRCLLLTNEPDAALAEFNTAVALRPEVPWAWNVRGFAHAISLDRDFRAAEHDLDYALLLDPEFLAARLNRGAVRLLQNQMTEAREDFLGVLERDHDNPPALYYLALADLRSQDLAHATERCDALLTQCPELRPALWLRAQIALTQADVEQLRAHLDRWLSQIDSKLEITSAAAAARRCQALRLLAEGSSGAARKLAQNLAMAEGQAAIDGGSASASLFNDIATQFLQQGQWEKAIGAAEKGLNCEGSAQTLAALHHVRGLAFVERAEWARAHEDFLAEASIPDKESWAPIMRADARALLGYIAARQAKPAEAQRYAMEAVIELRSVNHFSPWINLACVFNALADGDAQCRDEFQKSALMVLRHALDCGRSTNAEAQVVRAIRSDAALKSLQSLPEFAELVPAAPR